MMQHELQHDELLGPIVSQVGPCPLVPKDNPFAELAAAVVHQQLSMKAGGTLWKRVEALLDGQVAPHNMLNLSFEQLRSAGISAAKTKALQGMAHAWTQDTALWASMPDLDDLAVRTMLIKLPGVGPWTADMFLMFSLARPDIWPTGDLGLRKALQKLHALEALPDANQSTELGERWRPWRTAACWYLWRSLEL